MAWLVTFEAKEIQRYILQGDKLRELVGGSTLINRLVETYLPATLEQLNLDGTLVSGAAGWARLRFESKNDAETFVHTWPLLVQLYAPGLQVIQAATEITSTLPEAIREAGKELRAQRNILQCALPETPPLAERNPRTGLPAVGRTQKGELIDASAKRKRCYTEKDELGKKMAGDEHGLHKWPLDIDDVASGEQSFVAVVHADGNDLGSMLIRIGEHLRKGRSDDEAIRIYQALTKTIEDTTLQAAGEAFRRSVLPDAQDNGRMYFALRPVVIGGDDLTVIIRGDLAFTFTSAFLEAFERLSSEHIAANLNPFGIGKMPAKLTCCAGIAFVKKNFPFAQAYELAESLCSYTKERAKAQRDSHEDLAPSSLTFHRINTSMQQEFEVIRDRELTSKGTAPVSFCFGPYATGAESGKLPLLNNLQELACSLDELPTGAVRTLISTLYVDHAQAETDWRRIIEIAEVGRASRVKDALATLTDTGHPWGTDRRTPLYDAHVFEELTRRKAGSGSEPQGGAA